MTFEAYDLTIYSLLVVPVSSYFHVPIWYGFLVLTMTYVMRGLGGLAFGHVGDKIGRRNALIFTVLGYSVFTALTGLSWSLDALIVFRGITGLFIGGEYVSYSYTMEVVPKRSRGGLGGLLVTAYSIGFMLASLTFVIITDLMGSNFAAGGGWRWPFFVGILPALIALWLRTGVQESAAWVKATEATRERQRKRVPLFDVFKQPYVGRTLHAWILMAAMVWAYGAMILGLPRMLGLLKFSPAAIGELTFIANIGSFAGCFLGGWLSQIIGRKKALILASVLAIVILPFFAPVFVAAPSYLYMAVIVFVATAFIEAPFGVMPSYLSERYPTELRATGATGTYNLGQIIGGWATTLMAATVAATAAGWEYGVIWYSGVSLVVLIVLSAIGKETRDVDLDRYTEAVELQGGLPISATR